MDKVPGLKRHPPRLDAHMFFHGFVAKFDEPVCADGFFVPLVHFSEDCDQLLLVNVYMTGSEACFDVFGVQVACSSVYKVACNRGSPLKKLRVDSAHGTFGLKWIRSIDTTTSTRAKSMNSPLEVTVWEVDVVVLHESVGEIVCVQQEEFVTGDFNYVPNKHIPRLKFSVVGMLHGLPSQKVPTDDTRVANGWLANGNGVILHEELYDESSSLIFVPLGEQLGIEAHHESSPVPVEFFVDTLCVAIRKG